VPTPNLPPVPYIAPDAKLSDVVWAKWLQILQAVVSRMYKGQFAGLSVTEGANAKQGIAVLVAGTLVVANTAVTANSRIFLTSQVGGGAPGWVRVSARVAGTSFTILSSSATDTSTIAYEIFEPGT
jgi:hypothetical protein